LLDGEAIAVLHMHDGMICPHQKSIQAWILCIFYRHCQFNKDWDRREREREIYLHEKNCRQPKGQMPINAGAYFKSDNQ